MSVRLRFGEVLQDELLLLQSMDPEEAKAVLVKAFGTGQADSSPTGFIEQELSRTRESRVVKDLKSRNSILLEHVEGLQNRLDHVLEVARFQPSYAIPVEDRHTLGQAVANIILSDWHLEERVLPATVNGLNEFNLEIAKVRIQKVFQNASRLIKISRSSVDIQQAYVFLIGDLISGYIHEELKEVNELSPVQAILVAFELVSAGLCFLLEDAGLEHITVCCMYGNHGRTTQKMQIATGYANSYEWMLFHQLAVSFKGNPRISFEIPSASVGFVRIFDKTIRYMHGDSLKYQGGVGGIGVPVRKHIDRLNQHRRADMTYMGHWHQYTQPFEDVVINGSVIGPNPYSVRLGLHAESPRQTFHLLDRDRGFTIRTPIFCD
jgi:hypothetical protein